MKITRPTDVIDFWKNEGYLFSEIYQFQPSYIEWLILNTEKFIFDIDEFYKLPKQTAPRHGTF